MQPLTIKVIAPWLIINALMITIYFSGYADISRENGLLENIQVLILFVASLSAILLFRINEGRSYRWVVWGIGLLAVSFFLRELDLRRMDLNSWFVYYTSEKGRSVLTVLLWLPFFAYTYKHRQWAMNTVQCFSRTKAFWIFGAAAVWLVAGGLFDRGIISTEHKYFMEEILELNGYVFFLFATWKLSQTGSVLSDCYKQRSIST